MRSVATNYADAPDSATWRNAVKRFKVAVEADDPLARIGIVTVLAADGACAVLTEEERHQAQVVVVVTDRLNASVKLTLRRNAETVGAPVVLIVDDLNEKDLLAVVECKVVSIISRPSFTAPQLTKALRAAASGGAVIPSDLTRSVIHHLERLLRESAEHRTRSFGLERREIDVLRLIADGYDLPAVASQLRYSERTIRNIVSGLLRRLNLRNRAQAVAYAARAGLI
jgi:DNA-binding NarL/FixJ family response regulator